MSRDATTGATSAQKVTQTFEHPADATLVLRLKNGEQIETTKEHPFYVENRGFTAAGEMGIGTSIVTRAGPNAVLASSQVRHRAATVYNFEVENTHTYFVGQSDLWVHNQCKWVKPLDIRFSQQTINPNVAKLIDQMKKGLWDWERPGSELTVLDLGDGKYLTFDNRRLYAALETGMEKVRVNVVKPTDPYPASTTGKLWGKVFAERTKRNYLPDTGTSDLPRVTTTLPTGPP